MYNFRLIINFFIAGILLWLNTSCGILPGKGCWITGSVQKDSAYFPEPLLDYNPQDFDARLSIPDENNQVKIWVKGSEKNNFVQLFQEDNRSISEKIKLEPPFFTGSFTLKETTGKAVFVKFGNSRSNNIAGSSNEKIIKLHKIQDSGTIDNAFSFIVYGCFQPFHVKEDGKPYLLHNEDNPLNYEMRQLFKDIGLSNSINHYPSGEDSLTSKEMIKNPVLVIGTGDQIYVDAGYEAPDFEDHALSAWAHSCKDPYPLLNTEDYLDHLDKSYRNFYSFECFNEVLSTLPSISVWDDHEIRDGWGSHGDEYSKKTGAMSPYLKPYFEISKAAFISHQLMEIENEEKKATLVNDNRSLEQQYNYKGVPVFSFDLRSHRNIYEDKVISEDQLETFRNWCRDIKDSSEVIIISSIPFFYKPFMPLKLLGRIFQPALRDDINDGWYSKYNQGQRNEIIQEIIDLRNRNIKPIILSGDAHLGGMISAWFDSPEGERKRLCYEFIFSGLSHESLGEERKAYEIRLRKRTEGKKKNDPTFSVGDYQIQYIYEYTQGRLNFGALEFNTDKATTASLFTVGDDENFFAEIKLPLNWEETFDEYLERAEMIEKYTYLPPVLTKNRIPRKKDTTEGN